MPQLPPSLSLLIDLSWFLSNELGILYWAQISRNQENKRAHSENAVLFLNQNGGWPIFFLEYFDWYFKIGEIKKIHQKEKNIAETVH